MAVPVVIIVRLKVSLMLVLMMFSRVSRLILRMFSRTTIADDHRVVDRKADDGQQRRDDGQIEFVVGQHQRADRDQNIMDQAQSPRRAELQAEPRRRPIKANPDVNPIMTVAAMTDKRAASAQIFADLRSDGLDAANFEFVGAKLFGKRLS